MGSLQWSQKHTWKSTGKEKIEIKSVFVNGFYYGQWGLHPIGALMKSHVKQTPELFPGKQGKIINVWP